jgi:hypothetical protein
VLFSFWHKFSIFSFSHGREITYRVLCVRWIELLTPEQERLANRITLALTVIDAVLISANITIAYILLT